MKSQEKVCMSIRLKELRLERGLSQADIATMLGLDRSSYTYYELGKSQPTLHTLIVLADYYNVTMDYLLGRDLYAARKKAKK